MASRLVHWVKAARRDFDAFPAQARGDAADAIEVAARGFKAGTAKPMKGLGSGVFEIAIKHAFRVVYVLVKQSELWVVHAFQKKSTSGIKTPKIEIDLIRTRLNRLQGMIE